jgi:hypothetical protein
MPSGSDAVARSVSILGPVPVGMLVAVALLQAASTAAASPPATGDVLYRMTLLRAAPGRLLDLIGSLKPAAAEGPGRLVLRHSQGDQWDLMVLVTVGSYRQWAAAREAADRSLAPPELVAWQEDEFVRGPDLATLDGFSAAGLYHVEMFFAISGRQAELLREREMENAYLRALGRPTNAIFRRELGAAWDLFTIGAYRSWKHFAERDDILPEKSAAAARAAGFEGDDRIGPYLRSLIQSHHDTLATAVR